MKARSSVNLRVFLSVLLALLIAAAPLLADEAGPQQDAQAAPANLPSEDGAFWLSFGSTLVPQLILFGIVGVPLGSFPSDEHKRNVFLSAVAAGLIVGPSVGYFYGGVGRRGLNGIALRAAAGAVAILSFLLQTQALEVLLLPAAATLLVLAAYDVIRVRSCVRENNLRLQGKSLSVAPIVFPDKKGIGFGVTVRFSF